MCNIPQIENWYSKGEKNKQINISIKKYNSEKINIKKFKSLGFCHGYIFLFAIAILKRNKLYLYQKCLYEKCL